MVARQTVPKGKGSIITLSQAILLERYGEDALERVIKTCSTESQTILRGEIDTTEMYPESTIAEFTTGVYGVVGADAFPRLTRDLAKQQVNTALRLFMRLFGSPKQLSRNNHKLWAALHDTGRLEVIHGADDHSHIVTISDFRFPTPEYEKAFIEYHCGILEIAGAKNVRGTSEQVGDTYRQWYVWE